MRQFLERYVESAFPSLDSVIEVLSTRKTKIYIGVDPTGPDIHLGHATNLLVMKELQRQGHYVIFLIGDFTAMIGDPSGRDTARKVLTVEEVKKNMASYVAQVEMVLPRGSFEVRYNGEWFNKMPARELVQLGDYFTVQQMLARDMFQVRIKKEQPISIREFLYPLLQGYDSVALDVDGELCGNDQTFNALAGRDLIKILKNKEKFVITTKLLIDPTTDKKIMSKSEGRYISLNDTPEDMFGKVMALPDHMIATLYILCTETPMAVIDSARARIEKGENPKTIKEELATTLVALYHGADVAKSAREIFQKTFSEGAIPDQMPEYSLEGKAVGIARVLTDSGLVESKAEVQRLVEQHAISVNGELIDRWDHDVKVGDVIKVGPRRFLKIK